MEMKTETSFKFYEFFLFKNSLIFKKLILFMLSLLSKEIISLKIHPIVINVHLFVYKIVFNIICKILLHNY